MDCFSNNNCNRNWKCYEDFNFKPSVCCPNKEHRPCPCPPKKDFCCELMELVWKHFGQCCKPCPPCPPYRPCPPCRPCTVCPPCKPCKPCKPCPPPCRQFNYWTPYGNDAFDGSRDGKDFAPEVAAAFEEGQDE